MALSRRSVQRMSGSIWPGFVDAMTALLLVLMFVLTIFMIVQFILRETITGQEDALDALTEEVTSLARALGLEQQNSARLEDDLSRSQSAADRQAVLIANLTGQLSDRDRELSERDARITSFEAQVASLLAERDTALAEGAALAADLNAIEAERAELLSEQEALQLAIAQARDEIDAQTEAARLAAARRAALEALTEDLRARVTEGNASLADALARLDVAEAQATTLIETRDALAAELSEAEAARLAELAAAEALRARLADAETALSDQEAARLAEAAAAQALRDRLRNADDELTAMTLALEEQRREAEETLTLLAAAEAARADLNTQLAFAILARDNAQSALSETETDRDALNASLAAALLARDAATGDLEAARAALADATGNQEELTGRLAAALLERDGAIRELDEMRAALALATDGLTEATAQLEVSQQDRDRLSALLDAARAETAGQGDLRQQLADALAAKIAADAAVAEQIGEAERRAALLAAANSALADEQAQSAESRRKVTLLNQQVAALRAELGSLQALLDDAAGRDEAAQVQIDALGSQLNTALARVAAEERRRAELEEAERLRLEKEAERLKAEAAQLERYRSDFFGQMREVLANREGIRIDGDRFVFASEVLFESASAELSPGGRDQIAHVASLLGEVAGDIPPQVDWIIRVDGHTDNVPLSGTGRYRDNWELSQARALSVVRYMTDELDFPPRRLAATGFGEFRPVNPGNSPEARAQNRRIEMKLTER